MRRLGATYVQLVVPDKEAVYADLLPAEIVPAPRRPVHRLIELAVDAGVELVYPLDDAASRPAVGVVYHPTDTHWTGRGAYIGYRAACDALGARLSGLRVVRRGRDRVGRATPAPATSARSSTRRCAEPGSGRDWIPARGPSSDNLIYVTGRRLVTERPGEAGAELRHLRHLLCRVHAARSSPRPSAGSSSSTRPRSTARRARGAAGRGHGDHRRAGPSPAARRPRRARSARRGGGAKAPRRAG